jgi:hypothetical protein
MVLQDIDKYKLYRDTGKNSDFDYRIYNGSGKE